MGKIIFNFSFEQVDNAHENKTLRYSNYDLADLFNFC